MTPNSSVFLKAIQALVLGGVLMTFAQWSWSFGGFTSSVLVTSSAFYVVGFILRYRNWDGWLVFLVLFPYLAIHVIGLFKNENLFPYFIPGLTILGVVCLLLGFMTTITWVQKHKGLFFGTLSFSCLFMYTFGGLPSYLKYTEKLDQSLQPFHVYDANHNPLSSSDLANKKMVLEFWTTSCGVCTQQFHTLQKLHQKFETSEDVFVAAVFVGTREEWQTQNLQRHVEDFDFPVLFDWDRKLSKQLPLEGFPITYFIEQNNQVKFRLVGFSVSDHPRFFLWHWSRLLS